MSPRMCTVCGKPYIFGGTERHDACRRTERRLRLWRGIALLSVIAAALAGVVIAFR